MTGRDRLIDAASELLWERGYTGTSPASIQKRAGVGQGSMYHHFAGKAELAGSAIRRTAETMRREVQVATARADTAVGKLHAYLDMDRSPLLGCRLGRLMQDSEVIADAGLRGPAAEFFAWLRGWVADTIADGQRTGELLADADPAQVAALVVATVQGGYVLARAEQDEHPYLLAVRGAKKAISDLAPTGRSGS